jgi:hypothetical protein
MLMFLLLPLLVMPIEPLSPPPPSDERAAVLSRAAWRFAATRAELGESVVSAGFGLGERGAAGFGSSGVAALAFFADPKKDVMSRFAMIIII